MTVYIFLNIIILRTNDAPKCFVRITYESNHQIRFNAYVLVALILKPPGMAI